MRLDFDTIDETAIRGFYGGQGDTLACMYADEYNRIMRGRLAPGASIGLHRHDAGSEIVYILQGRGRAFLDGEREELSPGNCHYCPKGHSHSLENTGDGDLVFFAVVPCQ